MKNFTINPKLRKAIFSGLCLLMFIFGAVTQLHAKVFEAYDFDSYKAAINSVNDGSGGDTIRITGNIVLMDHPEIISQDVTVTADTHPDGTPIYSIITGNGYGTWVFDVNLKNYFSIENIMISESGIGTAISMEVANDYAEIKINNCIFTDNSSKAVWIMNGSKVFHPKITISNSIFSNNSGSGIYIETVITENYEDLTIVNCVANNNGDSNNNSSGISISENTSWSPENYVKCYISDCITNGNKGDGIYLDRTSGIIKNCTANHNNVHGFSIGVRSAISNSVAESNTSSGFDGTTCQATNCMAINNGLNGFWINGLSVLNGCAAINNGHSATNGNGFNVDGLVFNSTAAYNNNCGFLVRGIIINSTASDNTTGIRCSNGVSVYNSICYDNSDADLYNTYCKVFQVYNTVSANDSGFEDAYGDVGKHNCTTENPKLQGKTANGTNTNNPDDLKYYALGEGSSALELADKSLITREKLLEVIDEYDDFEDIFWFENVVTEAYIEDVLLYDQIGNLREFNDSRYDAGSITSNVGSGGSSLILSYDPKKVANYGKSTIVFYGKKIDGNIIITLKKQGESDIVAESIQTEYSATSDISTCFATFNFHNKKIGKWDIVVTCADTTETIKEGLEIETYIDSKIRMEILGPANVANGSWTTYNIKYANTGNTTLYCVPVIVEIITFTGISVEVKENWSYVHTDGVYTDKYATIDGVVHKLDTLHDFSGEAKYTTFVTPIIMNIPPYGKGTLSFKVKCFFDGIANHPIGFRAYSLQPMVDVDPETSKINFVMPMAGGSDALWGCLQTVAKMVWDVIKVPLGAIPGVGCGIQIAESLHSVGKVASIGNASWETGKVIAECASDVVPLGTAAKTAIKIFKGLSTANDIMEHAAGIISCLNSLIGYGLSESEVAELMAMLLGAFDPNNKCGPVSESGTTWFSDRDEFTYVINFENSSEATAPAQQVWITDNLDMNVFDLNTFEAGVMKIGDRMITDIPFNTQNYTWTVDMRPEMDLITEIQLTLNKSTGVATWYFKSIDPATGELPADALAGFLPPNDEEGAGQGFVMFTIKLKKGLPEDVVVANKATIIFDNNAPIVTPEWVNNKDIVPPASTILRPTSTIGEIELKWQGTDNQDGSGVYCYDIYLKQDNGEYERIISRTTATSMPFTVEEGVKYLFYSIATDNAGNRERDKVRPDISIPEDNLPFDDYAVTKWNNTFMLNLRKLAEEGYTVTDCKWYKNSDLIGDGFTYSAGSQISDKLEADVTYYFQLFTSSHGEVFSTNKIIIDNQNSKKLYVYPNPVPQGNSLTVEGVESGNLVEVYNYMGACISRTVATGNVVELMLAAPAGVYVVRANGEAVKVVIK